MFSLTSAAIFTWLLAVGAEAGVEVEMSSSIPTELTATAAPTEKPDPEAARCALDDPLHEIIVALSAAETYLLGEFQVRRYHLIRTLGLKWMYTGFISFQYYCSSSSDRWKDAMESSDSNRETGNATADDVSRTRRATPALKGKVT